MRCVFLQKRKSDRVVSSRGGVAGDTHNLEHVQVLNLTNTRGGGTRGDRDALHGSKTNCICAPDTARKKPVARDLDELWRFLAAWAH